MNYPLSIHPLPYIVAYRAPQQGLRGWTIEAQFTEESQAAGYMAAQPASMTERVLLVTESHYVFYQDLLPEMKAKFKGRTVAIT